MSSPIIIKTSQPDTEERLVLVPPGACTDYEDKPGRVRLVTTDARDATPADLGRGGFVLEKQPSQVAYLDMWNQRDAAITRAEKAERERDELRAQVAAAEGRFRAAEAERYALLAEVARLTAPGEGSEGGPWRAYGEPTDQELVDAFEHAYSNAPSVRTHATAIRTIYRLGVAHERARQQPAQDRATDEELAKIAYETSRVDGAKWEAVTFDSTRRQYLKIARAVAARVRQERCLVAQAVGMGVPIHASKERDGRWFVEAKNHSSVVQPADVPATLARLLGEVSRG